MNDLDHLFHQYFDLVPVVTEAQRRASFRLRYEVICLELQMPGYESERYPDGLETDEFDSRAEHILLWHKPSDSLAGTVRLILPDPDDPDAPLPIEEHAAAAFHDGFSPPTGKQRLHTAEISRCILARRFRSRAGEFGHTIGVQTSEQQNRDPRRRFPHPVIGIQRALFRLSAERDIHHWYAIMEPALNRLLRRFALDFTPVGSLIQYNGLRQPFWADLDPMLERTFHEQRDIWDFVTVNGAFTPGRS